jgi:hypothetical protein
MFEQIRPSRPGDGEGMARVWLSAGAYYAQRDSVVTGWLTAHVEHPADSVAHQMVRELGWIRLIVDALVVRRAVWRQGIVRLTTYAEGPVAVPFYERHVGYERRSILFQKPLTYPAAIRERSTYCMMPPCR